MSQPEGAERVRESVDTAEELKPESGMRVLRLSDIEPSPVRWLWRGRIARGKVTMIAGHPGLGKSQLALKIAATVTTGDRWPVASEHADPGAVLILSAEDDVADTIRPRLEAAGADLTRCLVIEAVNAKDNEGRECRRTFSLLTDLGRLEKEIEARGDVVLVIIDPITAYLGATDSHKNAEIRAALAPLAQLAARFSVAVIAISHLRKNIDGDAILRVSGSMAFVAAARAAFVVARDQADDERRLFLPIKNNLGNDTVGYAFKIQPATLKGGIETCSVVWEPEAITISANEALAPQGGKSGEPKLDSAITFLLDLLHNGPVAVNVIRRDAIEAGLSWATLRRAFTEMCVKTEKSSFGGGWQWRLPDDVPPGERADL